MVPEPNEIVGEPLGSVSPSVKRFMPKLTSRCQGLCFSGADPPQAKQSFITELRARKNRQIIGEQMFLVSATGELLRLTDK